MHSISFEIKKKIGYLTSGTIYW